MDYILQIISNYTVIISAVAATFSFLAVIFKDPDVLSCIKTFIKKLREAKFFRFFILSFVLILALFTINAIMNPPEIKINYTSDTAHITENITGTSKNIPDGQRIWILVHPYKTYKYYPQSEAYILSDGEWSLPQSVGIGSENDIGTKFDIIAVLADKKAQNEFKNYFDTAAVNHWPGMNNIPDTAKEYNKITVTRV